MRAARPGTDVRLAYLEQREPLLDTVIGELDGPFVIVPLLLISAFHARHDLPSRAAAAVEARESWGGLRIAEVLGSAPGLIDLLADRAASLHDEHGCDSYVLVAPGSSDPDANAFVVTVSGRLAERLGRPVEAGFVTWQPTVADGVRALRSGSSGGGDHPGARTIGLLPWFLAPGLLWDRGLAAAAELGVTAAAEPLADEDTVAEIVLERLEAAARP